MGHEVIIMYDENLFSERLAKLRIAKGVSARNMSLSIGQSANYINKIENKKAFPKMQIFFYICEYLDVSLSEFFDDGNTSPGILKELTTELKSLNKNALESLLGFVREAQEKK